MGNIQSSQSHVKDMVRWYLLRFILFSCTSCRLMHMKNFLGTIAKVGVAFVVLRFIGFLIVAGLIIWIIGALLT